MVMMIRLCLYLVTLGTVATTTFGFVMAPSTVSPPTTTTASNRRRPNQPIQASILQAGRTVRTSMVATDRNGVEATMPMADESEPPSSATVALFGHDDYISEIRLNVNEKARTVTSVCTSGTLCTVSAHEGIQGAPFGSFVDYVLDDVGNPVLLMNEMSMHTINVETAKQNGIDDAALVTLFTQLGSSNMDASGRGGGGGGASQDVSRCSLTGTLEKIDPSTAQDMDALRMRYSIAHAYADQVMDSPKFAFYRLLPRKVYFVGGFGVMAKWIEPADYQAANPDILAKEAPEIIQRINRDNVQDLINTAVHLLGITNEIVKIRLTTIDRLGMDIRVTTQMGTRRNKLQTDEFRIGFRIPVVSIEDAKSEVLKVFQEAWEKGQDMQWENDVEDPGESVPILKIAADSLE